MHASINSITLFFPVCHDTAVIVHFLHAEFTKVSKLAVLPLADQCGTGSFVASNNGPGIRRMTISAGSLTPGHLIHYSAEVMISHWPQ